MVARDGVTAARPRYIVDGYNVLLSPAYARRASLSVEAARTGFVGLVRTFAARERCAPPLVLVFDVRTGPPPPPEIDSEWLRIAHASIADDWIVAWLTRAGDDAQRACVVTSDIELGGRARATGATTESPERFLERIRSPRAVRPRGRADTHGGKPAPPRGDILLRELAEQSAPRDDAEDA